MAFARYEIGERIGVGGMAEVFRALAFRPDGSSLPVVVKRILPEYSEDPEFLSLFLDEAATAAKIEHKNVVRFLDFGRIDGRRSSAPHFRRAG